MPEPTDAHYAMILQAITSGRVIPFLGAGVNLSDRPEGATWAQRQAQYLPSGGELAEHLAGSFGYPGDDPRNLLRISQYVAVTMGSGPLYATLHDVFDADYAPTSLHRFLAALPALLASKGLPPHYPLILTTNYDDLMERALQEAGQSYDVVSYVADGEQRGKFVHWPPADGESAHEPVVIDRPNEYRGLALDERPVVLKIHGAIDRTSVDGERDSFVITEDHYIDYLTRTDLANLIPVTLVAKLKRSHFLFLGYSLSDWNLRVILHRIWGEQKLSWKSWAVQLNPEPIELEFWDQRGVDIVNARLDQYVAALRERLEALPVAGGAT
jgi:hypothetical protein